MFVDQVNGSIRITFVVSLFAIGSIAVVSDTYAQQYDRKAKLTPQQEYAVHLLNSVIDESREVEGVDNRTSLAESIVPLLASTLPDRCRQMLDAIFDAALRENERTPSDKKDSPFTPDATIRRIIQLAAGLDRKLADSYIEKYATDKESESSESSRDHQLTKRAAELYMKIAVDLVDKDPALAVSVAQRALMVSVPSETLTFLAKLRQKDLKLSNSVFLSALTGIKTRGGRDINELLLLYSYVFSPLQVLQTLPEGLGILSIASYQQIAVNYGADPTLAQSYLATATQIALNPSRYEAQNFGRLVEGPRGDLTFLMIIAPQVGTYLPSLIDSLSEQRGFLASFLQPDQRQQTEGSIDRWRKALGDSSASSDKPDTSDYYLRLAERVSDPKRKNQLWYRAAMAAVGERKYAVALATVDKMSDDYRDQARQFIRYHIAFEAAREGKLDLAEEWARQNLDLAQRAYLYTLLAQLLLKKPENTSQASGFLNEVEQMAAKLEPNQEKAAVLIGAAVVASKVDAGWAFRLLQDGIKAANKMDNFSGDISVRRSLNIGGFYFDYSLYRSEFTFSDAVTRLAAANFDETATDVRELKSRLARLRAIVSACSAVLGDKRASSHKI